MHCGTLPESSGEADVIRATERRRLAALVASDTTTAGPIHASDYQLINPLGEALSRADYLGGLASGLLDYLFWTPDSMSVRMAGDAAIVRYTAYASIVVAGDTVPGTRHWHTDYYEKRKGTWQVVWSQATAIR
jgi:hypothetical protein